MFRCPSLATFALLAGMAACPALAQHHAHAHGVVGLDLAIEQNTLTIELEAPLDSLVGFERAPRTDAEKKRVQQTVDTLRTAASLFTIDPAAQCKLQRVELESEVLGLGGQSAAPASGAGHSHGKDQTREEHADIDASFVFECAQAANAKFVDVGLFAAFPRIRTVNAQVAVPAGQFKRTLRKASARLTWGR